MVSRVKDLKKIILAQHVKKLVEDGMLNNSFEGSRRTIDNLEKFFIKRKVRL